MLWQHLTFQLYSQGVNYDARSFLIKKVLVQYSPLFQFIQLAEAHNYSLRASNKLVPYKCRTNRFRNSFIPSSIIQYSEQLN